MRKLYIRKFSVSLMLAAGTLCGQTPPAGPTFKTASVKASVPITSLTPAMLQSGKVHLGMTIDGSSVDIGFMPLADLIRTAYDVKPYQISGPDWMASQRFDIAAKLPEGATKEQVPAMLQALLADKFKLSIHREKKDHPVYALVVDKGGPKLKASDPEVVKPKEEKPKSGTAPGTVLDGPAGPVRMSMSAAGQHIEALKITLPALAELLTPMLDRPVVDMTRLKGTYQLTLDIPIAELMATVAKQAAAAGIAMPPGPVGPGGAAPAVPAASDPAGSSIFQSVQQYGLNLEPRKEQVDVIVIDHLEKIPTEK